METSESILVDQLDMRNQRNLLARINRKLIKRWQQVRKMTPRMKSSSSWGNWDYYILDIYRNTIVTAIDDLMWFDSLVQKDGFYTLPNQNETI